MNRSALGDRTTAARTAMPGMTRQATPTAPLGARVPQFRSAESARGIRRDKTTDDNDRDLDREDPDNDRDPDRDDPDRDPDDMDDNNGPGDGNTPPDDDENDDDDITKKPVATQKN